MVLTRVSDNTPDILYIYIGESNGTYACFRLYSLYILCIYRWIKWYLRVFQTILPTFCVYRWIKWNSFSVVFIVNAFHFTNLKWCYKLCIRITFERKKNIFNKHYISSFPNSWQTTTFVSIATRRVPPMEQEQLTRQRKLRSLNPVLSL